MAVAESASAQGKAASGETASPGQATNGFVGKIKGAAFAALLLANALALAPTQLAHAQAVADPTAPGNQRPTVLAAPNGVPVVNIQTPSAAGVSRNTFSQFDVQSNGIILNNSRSNVQTQLGGWVQGNPWLARGSARVILNEVNSSNPSQLRGYIEVGGQRAEVIIANPAGVLVDGAGFINASRATITTGTPLVNGGNLEGFVVQRGTITIEGKGLDATLTDYTGILARAVQANAGIWANKLEVVTGANTINTSSGDAQVSGPAAAQGPAPAFAIDVAQLGGMYAGHIRLVGTEAGLGVRNGGVIGASAGDVVLQTNGWLSNSGNVQAVGNVQAKTVGDINNSGTLYAANTTLQSQGNINNAAGGFIAAQGQVLLQAQGANSQINASTNSTLAAGLQTDGSLLPSGNLSASATSAANLNGQTIAGNSLSASAAQVNVADGSLSAKDIRLSATAGNLDASRASIVAQNSASVQAAQTLRTDAATVSATQLSVAANSLSNVGGSIVQTGTADMALNLAGNLDNTQGRIATNSQNLSLRSANLNNSEGKLEHAGTGALSINTGALQGSQGQITSNGALSIQAGAVEHNQASISATQVSINATSLANRQGEIIQTGSGPTALSISGALDNSAGLIASNGQTNISAQSLNNQGGTVQATGSAALGVSTTGLLDNSASGTIAAGGALSLQAGTLNNSLGEITTGSTLAASATHNINNTQGLMAANGAINLQAASLDNTQGVLASVQGSVAATTSGSTTNASGRIEAAGNISLQNSGFINAQAQGQTQAVGGSVVGAAIALNTNGQTLNNQAGTIAASQTVTLTTGSLQNDAGLIQAAGNLSINTQGQALQNTNAAGHASGEGGISSQGSLSISAGNWNNNAGFAGANGALNATTTQVNNQASGKIVSATDISLTNTGLNNQGGQVQSLGNLSINAGAGSIDNTGSLIRSSQNTQLSAQTVVNAGTLGQDQGIEGDNLQVSATNLGNSQGALRANNNLDLLVGQSLNNNQGLVSATNNATVQGSGAQNQLAISNSAGTLIADKQLSINAASLGGDGKVLSQQNLSVQLSQDFHNTGEVTANGNATITTAGNLSNSAKLQAGDTLQVNAANITNNAGAEINAGTTQLNATNTLTNRGLIDGYDTQINAATVNNLGTGRIYGDFVSIGATTLNNDQENGTSATIAARQRLDIGAQTINNRDGALILSAGDMHIGGAIDANRVATGKAALLNNSSATIESLGNLTLSAAQTTNVDPYLQVIPKGQQTGSVYKVMIRVPGGDLEPESNFIVRKNSGLKIWRKANPEKYGQRANEPAAVSIVEPYCAGSSEADICYPGSEYYEPRESTRFAQFGVQAPMPESAKPLPQSFGCFDAGYAVVCSNPQQQAAYDAAYSAWATSYSVALTQLDAAIAAYNAQVNADNAEIGLGGYWEHFTLTESTYRDVVTNMRPATISVGGNMTVDGALTNRDSRITVGGTLSNPEGTAFKPDNVEQKGTEYLVQDGTVKPRFSERCGKTNSRWCEYGTPSPYYAEQTKTFDFSTVTYTTNQAVAPINQAPTAAQPTGTTAAASGASLAAATVSAVTQTISAQPVTQPGAVPGPAPSIIRSTQPNTQLPTSSLYAVNTNPNARYVVETDPRFTEYRQWLSSDYLLSALQIDPAATQKRLGDGFYEQRLVREQLAQLTGHRFLGDYTSDDEQYRALMTDGATFAAAHQLRPGIALTDAQIAQLTSDIVWLVEKEVKLPSGQTTKALVPQVYVMVRPGDIDGSGSLIAARNINLQLQGDLTNSGTIAGRNVTAISANNIHNLGGRIGGNITALQAQQDIHNIGGSISAKQTLSLKAGRDLNVTTTTSTSENKVGANSFSRTGIDRVAGLYVSNPGGLLLAGAGNNINLTAANLQSQGSVQLQAGQDINLGTVRTARSDNINWSATNYLRSSTSQDIGTQIGSAGSTTLQAGQDVNAKAANVIAGSALVVTAQRDVNITAGQASQTQAEAQHIKSKGALSSKTTTTRSASASQEAIASSFEGASVGIQAGRDLTVQGSNVVSDSATTLMAKNNVSILAAENSQTNTSFAATKKSGLSSSGLSVSIGKQASSQDSQSTSTSVAASTIASLQGNVTIVAGNQYQQVGSDLATPQGDINVVAKTINIQEARETSHSQSESKTRQSGLTLGISNPLISAAQSTGQQLKAASQTSSSRMQALAAAGSALNISNNADALKQAAQDPSKSTSLSVSLGSSKSQSSTASSSNTARGSSLNAGGNITLVAQGGGEQSNISIQGSTVKADGQVSLEAENQIRLLAAQNTTTATSSQKSSGASIGMSLGAQSGVTVSANKASGSGNGTDTTHTNTQIQGNQVNLKSGGDTTLKGAVVAANTVKADIGGNLLIESLQDTATYTEKSKSSGGSITFGPGGIPTGGSVSAGKTAINSNYQSVTEQSGIKAGDGGFDITVKGKTNLVGGAITSSQKAVEEGKNSFSAAGQSAEEALKSGTLSITDIQNQASYTAKGSGATLGVGTELSKSGAGVGSDKGSAQSSTQAAISGLAGNKEARTGDKEGSIAPIFDKDKVKADVAAQVQITTEFGKQASRAVGDLGDKKLKEAQALKDKAQSESDPAKRQALEQQAGELEANWKEGGPARVALHALTGGLTGGLQGALGAGASQATVPTIAAEIAKLDIPVELKQTLIAAAGITIGAATGGQAGAATAINATAHNYLTHTELKTRAEQQKACSAGQAKACQAVRELDQLSEQRNSSVRGGVLAVSTEQGQQILQDLQSTMLGLSNYKQELQGQLDSTANPQERAQLQNQINQADIQIRQVANLGKDYHYQLFEKTQDPAHLAAYARLNSATSGNEMADGLMSGAALVGANNRVRLATPGGTGSAPSDYSQTNSNPGSYGPTTVRDANGNVIEQGVPNPGATQPRASTPDLPQPTVAKNSDGLTEVKIPVTPTQAQERLNTPDVGGNAQLKPAEAAGAAQLEPVLGTMQRYEPKPGDKTSADYIITSGPNAGKTVDFMYTTAKLTDKEVESMNKFFEQNWRATGQGTLNSHLNAADIVPLDFRNLTLANQRLVTDYVNKLPANQKSKILILR
jgi:filamentous hemagglutinin